MRIPRKNEQLAQIWNGDGRQRSLVLLGNSPSEPADGRPAYKDDVLRELYCDYLYVFYSKPPADKFSHTPYHKSFASLVDVVL